MKAVCSPSKIQSLKAIHNLASTYQTTTVLFAVRQRYKVWKQFTTWLQQKVATLLLFAVRQRYKVWKQFTTNGCERDANLRLFAVRQRYKVWKQFTTADEFMTDVFGLFAVRQRYKVWKQFTTQQLSFNLDLGCLQSVKDTKFESNSQHSTLSPYSQKAVCSPSKIQSLKAIHNGSG